MSDSHSGAEGCQPLLKTKKKKKKKSLC